MHRIGHGLYGIHRATLGDVGGIARVHVDAWRTTYRGVLRQAFLDSLSYDQREDQWRRALGDTAAGPTLVAREATGPVVAFAAGGPERNRRAQFDGELYALYVLEPYQRHGLGTALLVSVADALARSGHNAMLAWVLARNPAVGFYERRGGKRVDERSVTIAGDELEEIAFGWSDIDADLIRPSALRATSGRPEPGGSTDAT